jgi:two-component system response regulator FixJ
VEVRQALNILLVDDDAVGLDLLVHSLLKHVPVSQVRAAGSCPEALAEVRKNTYDCVLMDHLLPGTLGVECIAELRAAGFKGAIIILTGYAEVTLAIQAIKAGADDFLGKQQDLSSLYALIEVAVQKRSALVEAEQKKEKQQAHLRTLYNKAKEIVNSLGACFDGSDH